MLARKVAFATSLLTLLAACSSGSGIGDDPAGGKRPDDGEEDGGASGKGGKSGSAGKSGTGGKAGTSAKGGSGGTGGNGAGGSDIDEGGAGGGGTGGSGGSGGTGGSGGSGGSGGTGGGGGGTAGKGGAGGGAAGKAGASGAGGGGTAGKAGAGGTSAGGTSAGGTSAGGTSAGGTSAGGSNAGGTSAGGTSAGGSNAGGSSGGAPACVPSAAAEVCYNRKDDDCDGSEDEECPPLTLEGNWRWTFTFEGSQRRSSLALVGGNNVVGNAIDEYGFAAWTGTFNAGAKTFSLTKKYDDGDTFIYTGSATFTPAGVTVAGQWRPEAGGAATAFNGVLQTSRAVSNAVGAWKINAYFDPAVTANLAVSAQGYVTGTMSDNVGASTLSGIFDRGDGLLYVKKVYGSGSTRWWKGNVSANGQTITGGTIGDDPATFDYGSWTGQR